MADPDNERATGQSEGERLVFDSGKKRSYQDGEGEVQYRNLPDDINKVILPRLKKRFAMGERNGAFTESLPDEDTCFVIAESLRLAMSANPYFQDEDFVTEIQEYIVASPSGRQFGFEVAYQMMSAVFDAELNWKKTFTEEEIEVKQILRNGMSVVDQIAMVPAKYVGQEGHSIIMPKGKNTDPFKLGILSEDNKKIFVDLIIERIKQGGLTDNERTKISYLLARANTDEETSLTGWAQTYLDEEDVERITTELGNEELAKVQAANTTEVDRRVKAFLDEFGEVK